MNALALLLSIAAVGQVPDAKVARTLERFDAAKPSGKTLGFYSLDWAMSLEEANARAKKEKRPVLLILNTNISAGTNFFSGHT